MRLVVDVVGYIRSRSGGGGRGGEECWREMREANQRNGGHHHNNTHTQKFFTTNKQTKHALMTSTYDFNSILPSSKTPFFCRWISILVHICIHMSSTQLQLAKFNKSITTTKR
jgi:hypothetical protein